MKKTADKITTPEEKDSFPHLLQLAHIPKSTRRPSVIQIGSEEYVDSGEIAEHGCYGGVRCFLKGGEKVAIKQISVRDKSKLAKLLEDVRSDVNILNQLAKREKRSNIAADYFVDEKPSGEITIFIVTPYVEGATLATALANAETMDVFFDLLSDSLNALEDLHNDGVIHGDLKRDNIMVDIKGKFFYVDFSKGRFLTDAAVYVSDSSCEFIAPECKSDFGQPPPKPHPSQDIYSFGDMVQACIQTKIKELDSINSQEQIDFLESFSAQFDVAWSYYPKDRPPVAELKKFFTAAISRLETVPSYFKYSTSVSAESSPAQSKASVDSAASGASSEAEEEKHFEKNVSKAPESDTGNLHILLASENNLTTVLGLFYQVCESLIKLHRVDYVALSVNFNAIFVHTDASDGSVESIDFIDRKRVHFTKDPSAFKKNNFEDLKKQMMQLLTSKQFEKEDQNLLKDQREKLMSANSLYEIRDILLQNFPLQSVADVSEHSAAAPAPAAPISAKESSEAKKACGAPSLIIGTVSDNVMAVFGSSQQQPRHEPILKKALPPNDDVEAPAP